MAKKLKTRTVTALEKELTPNQKIQYLEKRIRELEAAAESMQVDTGGLEVLLEEVRNAAPGGRCRAINYHPPKRKLAVSATCAGVLHATDWHVGRVTKAEEIEGWGAFDYEKANARVEELVRAKLEDTEMERRNMRIDDLYVLSTGDMILGALRDSDVATAEWSMPVQVVKAGRLWERFLMGLAPHFKRVKVKWVVTDNHSRLSRAFNHGEPWNSMNYLVAELARSYTRNQKNVEWEVFPGELGMVEVMGMRYLLRHGHDMGKGGGGFGGIPYYEKDRAAGKEARRRMRRAREYQFDLIVMGHHHVPMWGLDWMIGGSLSGTDNFDHSQNRESRPAQTGWIVHPKHGIKHYNDYGLS